MIQNHGPLDKRRFLKRNSQLDMGKKEGGMSSEEFIKKKKGG